jgi:hypothetical protein
MRNLREVGDRIFMSNHAYYSKKYRTVRDSAPIIDLLVQFLVTDLGLPHKPTINFELNRANNARSEVQEKGYVFDEFNIYVDPRFELNSIIETICHEMVHVSQITRGDLNLLSTNITWKGKEYPYLGRLKSNRMSEYSKQPWENEAYEKQSGLKKKFLREMRKSLKQLKNFGLDKKLQSSIMNLR